MKKEKQIVTTSDVFTKEKKKGQPKILTTKDDVPEVLPYQEVEQPSKPITTCDVKEGKDEK